MAFFRLLVTEAPTIRLFDESKDNAKYRFPDGPITFETIDDFLSKFKAGKLKVWRVAAQRQS